MTEHRTTLMAQAARLVIDDTGPLPLHDVIDGMDNTLDMLRTQTAIADGDAGASNMANDLIQVDLLPAGGLNPREMILEVTSCPSLARSAQAELARVAKALVRKWPVTAIGWLDQDTVLERRDFLRALAPRQSAQRRHRLSADQAAQIRDDLVRYELKQPVTAKECDDMRASLGVPRIEHRLSNMAMSLFSATLALSQTSGAWTLGGF